MRFQVWIEGSLIGERDDLEAARKLAIKETNIYIKEWLDDEGSGIPSDFRPMIPYQIDGDGDVFVIIRDLTHYPTPNQIQQRIGAIKTSISELESMSDSPHCEASHFHFDTLGMKERQQLRDMRDSLSWLASGC